MARITQARALATIVSAIITFLLVTQTDIALHPAVKVILGAINVGLVAADWSALFGAPAEPAREGQAE